MWHPIVVRAVCVVVLYLLYASKPQIHPAFAKARRISMTVPVLTREKVQKEDACGIRQGVLCVTKKRECQSVAATIVQNVFRPFGDCYKTSADV